MAHIRKFRDGWRAEVQKNGIRASHVAPTKREAQAWALAKEQEIGGLKASKGMTFDQACQKYVATFSQRKAEGAAIWEARRFAEMAVFFGENTRIASIDAARVAEWRDWRMESVSASTVHRDANLLRHLFSMAIKEWRVIKDNPFDNLSMPRNPPPRNQVWTWRMIRRVLQAPMLNEREKQAVRAFHIALHTGMRLKEILSAEVVGRVALLERDKVDNEPVKVPLARKGAALFAKYQPFTISPATASATFAALTDTLLIEGLTFHDSRASALTWLARRYDVMTLARISRHKNLKTLLSTYYRETAEQIAARLR